MNNMTAKAREDQALRDDLERNGKKYRHTVEDRVAHVIHKQFVDGDTDLFVSGCKSIQEAAAFDDIAALRHFLAIGRAADTDNKGDTAAHRACENGAERALRELHKARAPLDTPNNQGWTPAHSAVIASRAPMVRLLHKLGVDLHQRDNSGCTAAHYAAQRNDVELLEALYFCQRLPRNNRCLGPRANNGATPAHLAAQHDGLEALRFLWRHGVELTATDHFGETPLHRAARHQHLRTVDGLRALTVGFDTPNAEHDTAHGLLRDTSYHWPENGGEAMLPLRELAKLRRDGKLSHADFRRLKFKAIDNAAEEDER